MHTFLDFDFLRTLPEGQIRNGFAEIVKISHVADKTTWDLLVKYGPDLVKTGFGRKEQDAAYSKELKEAADVICRRAIKVMLDLESPNLHEIGLDRGEHTKRRRCYIVAQSDRCLLAPLQSSPLATPSLPLSSSPPSLLFATDTPSPSTWHSA